MKEEYEKMLLLLESVFNLASLLENKEALTIEELDLLKVCRFYFDSAKSTESIYLAVCKNYIKLIGKEKSPITEEGILKNFRLNKLPEVITNIISNTQIETNNSPQENEEWLAAAAGFHIGGLNPISKVFGNE